MKGEKDAFAMSIFRCPLDLHLGETVLPEDEVRGDTILARFLDVSIWKKLVGVWFIDDLPVVEESDHAIGVHGLASVELEVLEVGQQSILDELLGARLESLDLVLRLALLLELGLDGLHVACCCQKKSQPNEIFLLRSLRGMGIVPFR